MTKLRGREREREPAGRREEVKVTGVMERDGKVEERGRGSEAARKSQ